MATVDLTDSKADSVEAIHASTSGKDVCKALETLGSAAGRLGAARDSAVWGTVCFVGVGGEVAFNVSPDSMRKQWTIVGSCTPPAHEISDSPASLNPRAAPASSNLPHHLRQSRERGFVLRPSSGRAASCEWTSASGKRVAWPERRLMCCRRPMNPNAASNSFPARITATLLCQVVTHILGAWHDTLRPVSSPPRDGELRRRVACPSPPAER